MEETYKQIDDFPNYSVSNKGQIKNNSSGKLLTCCKNLHGYLCVSLRKDGKTYNVKVHRCVASAFIPNNESKRCIDHINRDKTDNCVSNLRWATDTENQRNKLGHGMSGVKGVRFVSSREKFRATITVNRKQIHIGYFNTMDAAAAAYKDAAAELFGEFASSEF